LSNNIAAFRLVYLKREILGSIFDLYISTWLQQTTNNYVVFTRRQLVKIW